MTVHTPPTILYVDDDEVSRHAFTWVFRKAGFEVTEAGTGRDALRLVEDSPDLVILDVNLPDINGFEVCRRIKTHPATAAIPVLHLSAVFVTTADKTHGLDGGADGYLTKPVDPQEVLATAQALLRIHQAEEAARMAARDWQTTFDALSDAVCLLDAHGRVVRANRALANLLGQPVAAIVGQAFPELLPVILGPLDEPVLRCLREVQSRTVLEVAAPPRCFQLTIDPVLNDHGMAAGSVYLLADISERKRLEDHLRHAQKMEAVGQLAGGVAHDFNNLLTAITGNISLILDNMAADDPNFEVLQTVDRATWRAAELTRQLLGFARQTKLSFQPLQLSTVVEEVVAILRRTIDPRIRVDVTTMADLWPVHADSGHLAQMLMNLCLNAADAMPQGGRLQLATANVVPDAAYAAGHLEARAGEFVRLEVRDTGHGIAPEVLPRIFEPFFTTKEPGKGTGLGLAMVFGIVKRHDGWVECASIVNEGTTFHIYLPRYKVESAMGTTTTPALPGGGSETLLLVDDEEMIREVGRRVLERYGYHVLLAEDGRQALDVYRLHQAEIGLVILDLTMPHLSGRDTLRELLRINPATRVLFASGYFAESECETAPEGVAGFLHKPYRERDLAGMVRAALDQASSR